MTRGDDGHLIDDGTLRAFCVAALVAVGVNEIDASIVADTMIEANLRGVDSHGVRHLSGYTRALRRGMANANPDVSVERESETIMVMDGDFGLGQVACTRAMEAAVAKAKDYGFGAVTVRNSTHNGMVGYYPIMAARSGCIGFTTSSATRSNPPFGSTTPMLSGVLAYAIPTSGDPIVLDTVCTTVRPSKLREAVEAGEQIPPDWALDRDGRPTQDPAEALGGFRQWMGGHRGSGLAMVMGVFSGILSGGLFGMDLPLYASTGEPTANVREFGAERQSHFVSALDVDAFMARDDFIRRIDRLVRDVRSCDPAPGFESVMVPGEPEWRTRARRVNEGIPVPAAVWEDLNELGVDLELGAID